MSNVESAEAAGAWWSFCIFGAVVFIVLLAALTWPRIIADHRRRMARVRADRGQPIRLRRPAWTRLHYTYAPCEQAAHRIDPKRLLPITWDYPGGPRYRGSDQP